MSRLSRIFYLIAATLSMLGVPAPIKLSPGTSRWSETQLLEFEAGAPFKAITKPTKTRKGPKVLPVKGSAS